VREALFMALEPLADLSVLDLFAGSGALGIEALSRGASHVDFVEPSRKARHVLETNLETLGLVERSRVWPLVLPGGLRRLEAVIEDADLILLDPPYGGELATATLQALGRLSIAPGARVVVEHHHRDVLPEVVGGLERERERRYGETLVTTYRPSRAKEEERA
jgi:16S rRNA (guanine(966)-N(2))-methyltransferase RsmD